MATLLEIGSLPGSTGWDALVKKVAAAVVVKAAAIINEATPTDAEKAWAKLALGDPRGQAGAIVFFAVGSNSTLTVAQILAANDTAVQNAVNDAVDKLLGL